MKKYIVFCLCCLLSKEAFAYIDPGIGSMFVQGLIAGILIIPFYYKKLIKWIKGLFGKKKETIDD